MATAGINVFICASVCITLECPLPLGWAEIQSPCGGGDLASLDGREVGCLRSSPAGAWTAGAWTGHRFLTRVPLVPSADQKTCQQAEKAIRV